MIGFSIEERAITLAHYIIDSKDTVRGAAKKYGISKSTVHKDVSERLLKINPALASEVRVILDENKAERHIRGGQATKLKYRNECTFIFSLTFTTNKDIIIIGNGETTNVVCQ